MKSIFTLRRIGFAVILLAVGTLSSCYKDYFETDKYTLGDYEPELAVPIIHSRLTIEKVAPNGLGAAIDIANDFFVSFIYTSKRESPAANEMFPFLDQNFMGVVTIDDTDATQINSGTGATKTSNGSATLVTNGELFTGVNMATGTLSLNISNQIPAGVSLTITFPNLLLNGTPISQLINLSANGNSNATINLAGISGTFTPANVLAYTLSAVIDGGTGANNTQVITVSANLSGVSYSKILGNFGTKTINIDADSTQIDLFNNAFTQGTFNILEPKLTVKFTNNMLIPASTQASLLLGYTPDQPNIPFFAPTLSALINYGVPAVLGQDASIERIADWNNSSIKLIVDGKRNFLVTDFDPTINPLGGNASNEALGDGKFTIEKQLELPLRGLAFNFFIQDTFDFAFGENADKIRSALFRIATKNSFPVDGRLQVFFTDENYTVLDSLVHTTEQTFILSAPTDANGKSIGETTKSTDFEMDASRFINIKSGKKIILRANIASTDNGGKTVKIYSSDYIDLKLGMKVKYAFGEL